MPIHQVGNCSCAVGFLTNQIGPKDAEIMLKLWASGGGRLGEEGPTMIHKEYGPQVLREAALRFSKVRRTFLERCRPPGNEFTFELAWPD